MSREVIRAGDYAFRTIEEDDLQMLLDWRNSPRIHSKMRTDSLITPETHRKWFESFRHDPIQTHFVITYKNKPVGFYAYNAFDPEQHTCDPGVYIAEKCPIDAAVFVNWLAAEYGYSIGVRKFLVDVLSSNKRIVKLNRLFGCKFDREKDYYIEKNGRRELVLRGVSSIDNWPEARAWFKETFGVP